LKIDAETSLQYIFGREEIRSCPIFLYGQSLGGAVAIYLAEKHHNEVPPNPISPSLCLVDQRVLDGINRRSMRW
jgi:alpha-beta hydrolase superfamily lysophospholipase